MPTVAAIGAVAATAASTGYAASQGSPDYAGLAAQQEAERRAASQQKVQRARANAVSTSTATPSGVMASAGEKGLRDEIAANLRAVAGGRV